MLCFSAASSFSDLRRQMLLLPPSRPRGTNLCVLSPRNSRRVCQTKHTRTNDRSQRFASKQAC